MDTVRILLGWLIEVSITSPFPQQPGGMGSDPCPKKKVAFFSEFGETSASENIVGFFLLSPSLRPPAVLPPPPTSLVSNLVWPLLERDGHFFLKKVMHCLLN